MKTKTKSNGYIKMNYSVIYNAEISDSAKILLTHFISMSERFNGNFFAQVKVLSTTFNKSEKEISTIISELCEKDYLINKLMNGKCYLSINYNHLNNAPQTAWRKSDRIANNSTIGKVKVAASAEEKKEQEEEKDKMHKYAEKCINMQNSENTEKPNTKIEEEKIDFFSDYWKEKDVSFFNKYCPNTEVSKEMYEQVMATAKRIYEKCEQINKEKISGDTNCIYCAVNSEEMKKCAVQNFLMFLENRGLLNYECFWREGVRYIGFSTLKNIDEITSKNEENAEKNESPVDDVNNIISINWEKVRQEERQLIIDEKTRTLLWRIRTNYKKNGKRPMEFNNYVREHKITVAEKNMMTLLKNMELLKVWKNDYDGKFYFKPIYTRYIKEMS